MESVEVLESQIVTLTDQPAPNEAQKNDQTLEEGKIAIQNKEVQNLKNKLRLFAEEEGGSEDCNKSRRTEVEAGDAMGLQVGKKVGHEFLQQCVQNVEQRYQVVEIVAVVEKESALD